MLTIMTPLYCHPRYIVQTGFGSVSIPVSPETLGKSKESSLRPWFLRHLQPWMLCSTGARCSRVGHCLPRPSLYPTPFHPPTSRLCQEDMQVEEGDKCYREVSHHLSG